MLVNAAAAAFAFSPAGVANAAEPLKVVASFSILGDLVAEVGGEHVAIRTLIGPNGDAHVYAPTPADARDVAAADIVFVNGLGFEGWLDRLIEASGYSGIVTIASDGVTAIKFPDGEGEGEEAHDHMAEAHESHEGTGHDPHGGVDPHAWQSAANAGLYVKNIAAALCKADPAACPDYEANAAAYLAELADLDNSIKAGFAAIPAERRKAITTHDAFGYFAGDYGVTFLAPQGASTDAEASAGGVADLIRQIRGEGVTAVFFENISDPRLIERISDETGVEPGGELLSDALSEAGGPAATYLDMMRHNADLLRNAMQGS